MPPLKEKKLKTEYVPLKISKLLPLVVKQGNFLNAHCFGFLDAFFPKAGQHHRRINRLKCNDPNFYLSWIEASAKAVKTPGGGFVLTRFLLPFHRMEKEEPVRLEDKNILIQNKSF